MDCWKNDRLINPREEREIAMLSNHISIQTSECGQSKDKDKNDFKYGENLSGRMMKQESVNRIMACLIARFHRNNNNNNNNNNKFRII